jgi:hypothetical protein
LDPKQFTAAAYHEKVEWIKEAAGDRFDDIELGVQLLLFAITDDPHKTIETFVAGWAPVSGRPTNGMNLTADELLASPVDAVGSLDEVCGKLLETREIFGFSYFAGPVGVNIDSLTPVIERLARA